MSSQNPHQILKATQLYYWKHLQISTSLYPNFWHHWHREISVNSRSEYSQLDYEKDRTHKYSLCSPIRMDRYILVELITWKVGLNESETIINHWQVCCFYSLHCWKQNFILLVWIWMYHNIAIPFNIVIKYKPNYVLLYSIGVWF